MKSRFVGFKVDPLIYEALEALVNDPAGEGQWNLTAKSVGELLSRLALNHCRYVGGTESNRKAIEQATRTKVANAVYFGDMGARRRSPRKRGEGDHARPPASGRSAGKIRPTSASGGAARVASA